MAETMNRIYLDYNATTPVDEAVFEAMAPYLKDSWGNPVSAHSFGQEAQAAVEDARSAVADLIGASPHEIYFTSGATESNNLAIIGYARANAQGGRHLVTASIEHYAVENPCDFLEGQGFSVTRLPVDRDGVVEPAAFEKALRSDTILATIMHANNEIGTIQPIAELAGIAGSKGIAFHTDAAQSVGKIPVDVKSLGVGLLSLSGHKFYGPKGVGAIFVRKGIKIAPLITGGHQERGLRAGTLNVPGIVGLGEAAKVAAGRLEDDAAALVSLRDRLEAEICKCVEGVHVNGGGRRLPNTLNVSVEGVTGPDLMVALDLEGVAVSTGAACASGAAEPSHVLKAMGIPADIALGSIRISLGRHTAEEELERFLKILPRAVQRARKK